MYIFDVYDKYTWPGKIYQQNLQTWWRDGNCARGSYWRDPPAGKWWHFYEAVTNEPPTSEKIVSWYRCGYGRGGKDQIWDYMMRSNRYQVVIRIIMTIQILIYILGRYILRTYITDIIGLVILKEDTIIKIIMVLGTSSISHYIITCLVRR